MMLVEYLSLHKLRQSSERKTILQCIMKNPDHFTAANVIEWVRPHFISQATVYNTLRVLEDAQIVHCLHAQHSGRLMEYEVTLGEQSTMKIVCTRCGRITDVTDKATQTAIHMKNYPNFIMRRYSVYVFGECKKCLKNKAPKLN